MPGLESALRLLDSASWEERVEAVRRLSQFDDPRALEGLKRALYDARDTAVTQAAAEELLARFDDFSQETLAEASRSEDADVARTVTDVLLGARARGWFAEGLLGEGW